LIVELRILSLSHVDIHLRVLNLELTRLLVLVIVNHAVILVLQYRIVF